MSVIRIAFLGTPDFAKSHLQSLLQDPHFEVVGVVTQPDRQSGRNMRLTPCPVKQFALEKNLRVYTPESIKTETALKEIAGWKAEAAVVVAYGQIVPQKFLDIFPGKVVNVHGSILPRWRGAAPIQRALMAGDSETGVSLQVMVHKLDAGAVIGSYSLAITDDMDALGLHDALIPLGTKLLHVDFMDYLRGNLMPVPQDESAVTYAHKIEKSEAAIDWSKSARQVFNHIRGMQMGPGSSTSLKDFKIKIRKAKPVAGSGAPGEVIQVAADHFVVACGEGALAVEELQPESRPRMKVRDFLLGYELKRGAKLK